MKKHIINKELQEQILVKRENLQLSSSTVANTLSINLSTYRRWENGKTKTCNRIQWQKIKDFLSGKFDPILLEKSKHPMQEPALVQVTECLSRASQVHRILADNMEMQHRFESALLQVVIDTLQEYIIS